MSAAPDPRTRAADEPFVVRQEADHVDGKGVRRVATLAAIAFAGSLAVTVALLRSGDAHHPTAPSSSAAVPPLGTVERTLLVTERGVDLRVRQRASLDHFGWVDRDAGVATIPVDRAMDILADRAAHAAGASDGGTPP